MFKTPSTLVHLFRKRNRSDNVCIISRKDSEQTKQIEDLQKQNEELLDEKECLIEEIKRMISETGKI